MKKPVTSRRAVLKVTALVASTNLFNLIGIKSASAAPTLPTAVCKKVGQKIIVNGQHFICVLSKKKLIWGLDTSIKGVVQIHPTPTPTPSSSVTPSPTPTPTATTTHTAAPTPTATETATGYFVIKRSSLVEGIPQIISATDLRGTTTDVLVDMVGGVVTIHSTICTHMGCAVVVNRNGILCPCHGAEYNPFTGSVTNGPAPRPLAAYKVGEINGGIYILTI